MRASGEQAMVFLCEWCCAERLQLLFITIVMSSTVHSLFIYCAQSGERVMMCMWSKWPEEGAPMEHRGRGGS